MEIFVSSEFDIFAPRPLQSSVLETTVATYKPVDHGDPEFIVPDDNDTYIDPKKLYVRGKLTNAIGADLDYTDCTDGTNNFLHSLFSQCTIALNGENVTPAADDYNSRAFFETILTYGSDAAVLHLTNGFWYLDDGDIVPCDPTAEGVKNVGFVTRWKGLKQSKEVQLCGRLHSDIFNVPRFLPPGVRIQIRLTKARSSFYLMNKYAESKAVFKFLDAQLLVNRVRQSATVLLLHETAFSHKAVTRYNVTRIELKTFTFSGAS